MMDWVTNLSSWSTRTSESCSSLPVSSEHRAAAARAQGGAGGETVVDTDGRLRRALQNPDPAAMMLAGMNMVVASCPDEV